MLLRIATYCIWFYIYSTIGWIYESSLRSCTSKKLINSGFLNGPYIPIYGFGAVLDILILGSIDNPVLLFILSATINCVLEYFTSYMMELLFHARWWDYSNQPLNINGRVCLLGYLAFGSFALIVIMYFHPWLVSHTTDLLNPKIIYYLAIFIVTVMSIDTYITVINLKDLEEKINELIIALEDAKKHIDDTIEERIDSKVDKIIQLHKYLNAQQRRLVEAFPNLKFKKAKYEVKEILLMFKQANKELLEGGDND